MFLRTSVLRSKYFIEICVNTHSSFNNYFDNIYLKIT